jgi:hypothetical protein
LARKLSVQEIKAETHKTNANMEFVVLEDLSKIPNSLQFPLKESNTKKRNKVSYSVSIETGVLIKSFSKMVNCGKLLYRSNEDFTVFCWHV